MTGCKKRQSLFRTTGLVLPKNLKNGFVLQESESDKSAKLSFSRKKVLPQLKVSICEEKKKFVFK